jgi:hypothetical protein
MTCGHDNQCYPVDSGIEVYDENGIAKFYICREDRINDQPTGMAEWKEAPKVLHVGRMINYERGRDVNIGDDYYLAEMGVTGACEPSNYTSCSFTGPYFAQQYCSSFATSFDAMLSLELSMKVPVQVGEFGLYNPYTPAVEVVSESGGWVDES